MKFHLTIELGNDAMRTGEDLANALHAVAADLREQYDTAEVFPERSRIADANGNAVGTWAIIR